MIAYARSNGPVLHRPIELALFSATSFSYPRNAAGCVGRSGSVPEDTVGGRLEGDGSFGGSAVRGPLRFGLHQPVIRGLAVKTHAYGDLSFVSAVDHASDDNLYSPDPSPAPACPPGCSYPSNFDAITVLASSATLVAVVTVHMGAGGTVTVDTVLQDNPNHNVYPPHTGRSAAPYGHR
jgi:hypothetical protein